MTEIKGYRADVVVFDEATDAPTRYEIDLPLVPRRPGGLPLPPLSANDRYHWRIEHQRKKILRTAARAGATRARIGQCAHLTVQLHYAPGDNRTRRDPANLCATSKPAIDGLVDAGLVPDDTPQWVTERMPEIHLGPGPRRLWLTVECTR